MFVLMFWILIIECMTVEIKVVYGTDRVIITIPVHVKKTHHTRTVYKIVERPAVAAGLRANHRRPPPPTTAPGGPPDGGRANPYEHRYAAGRPRGEHQRPRAVRVVGRHKHGHYADAVYARVRGPGPARGPPRHAYPARHGPAYSGDRARKPPRRGAQTMLPGSAAPGRAVPVRFRPAVPVVVPPPPRPKRPSGQDAVRGDDDDGGGGGGYRVKENFEDDGRSPTAQDPSPHVAVGPAAAVRQRAPPPDGTSSPVAVSPHKPTLATQQAALAPERAALAPQQAALAPERAALAPQHAALAPERAALAPQHAALAPQHAAFAPQHAAFAPQHAAFAPQQAAFASQQAAFAPQQAAVSHVYYTLDPVVPYDDVPRRPSG